MTTAKKAPSATQAAKTQKNLPSLVDQIEEAWHTTSDEAKKAAMIAVAKRVEALEQQ